MATVYRCDRCRTISDIPNFLQPVNVPPAAAGEPATNVELCGTCIEAFHEFVQPLLDAARA